MPCHAIPHLHKTCSANRVSFIAVNLHIEVSFRAGYKHICEEDMHSHFLHFIKGKILLALQHDPLPLMFYFDT